MRRKRILTILGSVFSILLSLGMLAFACAALILSRPQPEDAPAPSSQPPLSARAELSIQKETDLADLVADFPVPVMSFMSGSGMRFVSAQTVSFPLAEGFGRTASLYWQTEDGVPLLLQSIYPASALDRLDSGYHFSAVAGPSLFGSASVRMENREAVRVHVATDTGLYVMIMPKSAASSVSSISRSLQLFTLSPEG